MYTGTAFLCILEGKYFKEIGPFRMEEEKKTVFDGDTFVPGEVEPYQWVTRKFNRIKCFDDKSYLEAIKFGLMNLIEGEVKYALEIAEETDSNISDFIIILEDICDKTRLVRGFFQPKPRLVHIGKTPQVEITKNLAQLEKDRIKVMSSSIKCYKCEGSGHNFQRFLKNINAVGPKMDENPKADKGENFEDEG